MRTLLIAVGLALIAPAAFGQPSPATRERAYCERLYEMHDRYVARIKRNGSTMRDGMADLAVDNCRNGRFSEGIPVLEAKLAQARIPLPDR
jgi:hypothetical protein